MSFPCLYLRATLIYTPAACVDFMWGCTLVPGAHHDNPCNMCYTGCIRRARHSLLSHADASAEQGSAAGVSLLLSSRKARGFAARVPRCQVSPPCSPPLCLQCSAACRLKKKDPISFSFPPHTDPPHHRSASVGTANFLLEAAFHGPSVCGGYYRPEMM